MVAQKSLAKSLIKCRKNKKIGVELLEASVAELNPYNMRKTHLFGGLLNYDPGKYASRTYPTNDQDTATTATTPTNSNKSDGTSRSSSSDTNNRTGDKDDNNNNNSNRIRNNTTSAVKSDRNSEGGGTSIRKDATVGSVLATDEDEIDAPWNQYAWIEEMHLRVSEVLSLV